MASAWGLVRMPKEAGFTVALTDGKGPVTLTHPLPRTDSCWFDGEEEGRMLGIEKGLEYPTPFPR